MEIERKFLVTRLPHELDCRPHQRVEQGRRTGSAR